MPPRRELNERFQGHIRRAQRARAASTVFLATLTVLAVVGSGALPSKTSRPTRSRHAQPPLDRNQATRRRIVPSLARCRRRMPVTFNWRDANSSTAAQIGLIAQDVANVFPEIVTRGATSTLAPDGALGIQYTGLIPPIVKAIQELNLKLEDLATTTSATSTDQSSFTTRFFASLFARLTQWFADAQNSIADFFAHRVHTQEICTTPSDGMQVCASADQLAAILAGTSAGAPREQGARRVHPDPILGEGADTARLPHHPTTNQPWMKKRVLPTLRVRVASRSAGSVVHIGGHQCGRHNHYHPRRDRPRWRRRSCSKRQPASRG